MRTMVISLVMTVVAAAGCAHGTATAENQRRDLRGGIRVGQQARAVVVGKAALVHATGDKPVRWSVAERVNGDDRDCANPAALVALPESMRAEVAVGSGRVLCAAVASGATDVTFHQFVDGNDSLWALR